MLDGHRNLPAGGLPSADGADSAAPSAITVCFGNNDRNSAGGGGNQPWRLIDRQLQLCESLPSVV